MQFQQDWPKDEKITTLKLLPENLEKFRSTELYDAPLEVSKVRAARAKHGYHNHPQKGVNYHFPWPEFNKWYVVGKLSILES